VRKTSFFRVSSATAGHAPRKRFGQNFLVDGAVIAAIVHAIDPRPGETLVEIGPGLGALTQPLLERLGALHVVEIDRDLIARLRARFTPEQVTIHAGDALAFDFAALAIHAPLRVAGNLPYNISTPLLFHLARFADRVRDMHFMLQKEVVERICAEAGSTAYGRLSVMLQSRFYVEALFDVSPESFDPPPKVRSAIVRLIPKPCAALPDVSAAALSTVVSIAFSQRRKMLRNTLKSLFTEADLAAQKIDPAARAEALTLDDFVRLAKILPGIKANYGSE
jgi:16S rRNA (adenine1518-N6/adenine1519-N6)-dimethyltransferase